MTIKESWRDQIPPEIYSNILTPLMISGCFNLALAAACATGACVFICILPVIPLPLPVQGAIGLLSLPLAALAVLEFVWRGKLRDPSNYTRLTRSTRLLALAEVCTILVGNVASVFCGCVVLANLNKLSMVAESERWNEKRQDL